MNDMGIKDTIVESSVSTEHRNTDTKNIIIQDTPQRQRALDIDASFIVSAPAGSGKTELLIQRLLKLLGQCQYPEQILVITFTRKAAEEMRTRLVNALNKAINYQGETLKEHELATLTLAQTVVNNNNELQWDLLRNKHRLQIKTFDSFCHSLSLQTVKSSGQLLAPNVVENAYFLYRQAVRNLFATLEHPDEKPTLVAALTLLLKRYDSYANLSDMLCNMLNNRASWLSKIFTLDTTASNIKQSFTDFYVDTISELKQQAHSYFPELQGQLNFCRQHLTGANLPDDVMLLYHEVTPQQWLELIDKLLLTKQGEWRKSLNKNNGFPAGDETKSHKDQMLELLGEMSKDEYLHQHLLLVRQVSQVEMTEDSNHDEHLSALILVLKWLLAQANVVFSETGECDYTEIAINAYTALKNMGEPGNLIQQLDYQLQHILVDEFQDTSNLQFDLLELLTSGWESNDGRSLFFVGDPMQSIYSFRDANVDLFTNIQQQGISDITLEPLYLTANFRSQKPIVEWVNRYFEPISRLQSMSHFKFSAAQAVKNIASKNSVDVIVKQCIDDEVQEVVQTIQRIAQQNPDEKIAILLRTRKELDLILGTLRDEDIGYWAHDIATLDKSAVVSDIHHLHKALHNGADRISWVAFLRSTICGLDNFDLFYLCTNNKFVHSGMLMEASPECFEWHPVWESLLEAEHNYSISQVGRDIIARVVSVLKEAMVLLGSVSTTMVLQNCWEALGGYTYIDENEADNIASYLEIVEDHWVAGGIEDWGYIEDQLQNSKLSTSYASKNPISEHPVEIMTLHKVKGLEFDHVLIPFCAGSSGSDKNPLFLWRQQQLCNGDRALLICAKHAIGEVDYHYDLLKFLVKRLQKQELSRLFYVGCTRAIKSLYLLGSYEKNVPVNTFFKLLEQVNHETFAINEMNNEATYEQVSNHVEAVNKENTQHENVLKRLPVDFQIIAPAIERLKSYTSELTELISNTTAMDTKVCDDHWTQRLIQEQQLQKKVLLRQRSGVMLHRILKQVVTDGVVVWQNIHRRQQQALIWRQSLGVEGFNEQEVKGIVHEAMHGLDNILLDDKGLWILDRKHDHSACELSLDFMDSQQQKVRTIIIDRTFVVDGCRWVIDYKTATPGEEETLEHFLLRQKYHYQQQLEIYAQVIKKWTPEYEVKKMLYFPMISNYCLIE